MSGGRARRVIDVAIAGFGHVGRELVRVLAALPAGESPAFRVVALADSRGCVSDWAGVVPSRLLDLAVSKEAGVCLGAAPAARRGPTALLEALDGKWPAILVETGPTEAGGGAAAQRAEEALRAGASVVLASKGPVAWRWDSLAEAAGGEAALRKRLLFSAAAGAGIPVVDLGRALALGSPINGVAACLNRTSNLVLDLMEKGLRLKAAIERAQALGIAEADPQADLDGLDAALKLCILSRALFGSALRPEELRRESVREATASRIADARSRGARLRAVGRLAARDGTISAQVALEELPATSPLAVSGGECAVLFDCERSGLVSLVGRGAGPAETASALLRDLRVLAGPRR